MTDRWSIGTRTMAVLLLTLPTIPSCLGDTDNPMDEGVAGAGGSMGETAPAGGGNAAGGKAESGGAAATGGLGGDGSGGDGGMPTSYPKDAFVMVWETTPHDFGWTEWPWGYFTGSWEQRTVYLPLAEEGTYDFVVDWGDGTTSEVTSPDDADRNHQYDEAGLYVVVIRGIFEGSRFRRHCVDVDEAETPCQMMSMGIGLREIRQWGTFRFGAIPGAFLDARNLVVTATDVPDLSPPVNLSSAFEKHSSLTEIPFIAEWDVSNASDMSSMFRKAQSFDDDLSAWDTSNVTDMSHMFELAHAFNGDISDWDTSNVTNMASMLEQTSFNGDISDWDTSSVTNMASMFRRTEYYAKKNAFNGDLSAWDTSKVTNMSAMFFYAGTFDGDISGWDTSNVRNMAGMFHGAYAFNRDLAAWDTSKVTNMSAMFAGALSFNGDISTWDTSNVKDMSYMFLRLTHLRGHEIPGWSTSSMAHVFGAKSHSSASRADSTTYGEMLIAFPYSTGSVPKRSGTSSLGVFDGDLSAWDTSNVSNMAAMFAYADAFNSDLSAWDTSNVADMSEMFLDAALFDQNLGEWHIGALTDATQMLSGAGLSSENYGALLIGWAAQPTNVGVWFGAGVTRYPAVAADARAVLTESRSWHISDGGLDLGIGGASP